MPVTAELGLLAMLVGLVIAIPVGVISAVRQDTWSDYLGRSAAIGMLAIPSFWLGHAGDHAAVRLVGVDAAAALHAPARRSRPRTWRTSSSRRSSWGWRSPGR